MQRAIIGRRFALGLLTGGALARPAIAATALDRPARIVIGLPPGSGSDLVARIMAEALRGRYAVQVVVENRPGASTRIAVEAVKAAAPNGATMLQTPLTVLTLMPHVFPRTTRYDGLVDFVPVTTIATVSYGWVVREDHPARTLPAFLDWARTRGGATFAPPVLGAPQHLMGLTVGQRAGVTLTPVSYRGGAPALQDLLAGQIDAVISTMGDLATLVRAGRTRLIAVSTRERHAAWPDVPTLAECGFDGLPTDEAYGMLLPAHTPPALTSALHEAMAAAVATAAVRDGLARLEMTPLSMTPLALAERLASERDRWAPIVRASGFVSDEVALDVARTLARRQTSAA